jgi:hypothetical protein
MKARHERELALRAALATLYPLMPEADKLACAQRAQGKANPEDPREVYLAAAACARHRHTDYDKLCPQGADEDTRQNARRAVRAAERAKLREWGGPDRAP